MIAFSIKHQWAFSHSIGSLIGIPCYSGRARGAFRIVSLKANELRKEGKIEMNLE